uniref:Uncharacterized protein n=1 Tax=Anguilla anguilla TaxID=7936 RepID=A0A0E9WHU6_ANGAN
MWSAPFGHKARFLKHEFQDIFLINALSPSSQFANHVHTAAVIITSAFILGEHRQMCSSLKHTMSATASYTTIRKSDSRRHESEEDE